jgi:hypothetical protein
MPKKGKRGRSREGGKFVPSSHKKPKGEEDKLDSEKVVGSYDNVARQTMEERKRSDDSHYRNACNKVKSDIFDRIHAGSPGKVVDACSGQGGDQWKAWKSGVRWYRAMEWNAARVEEARKRLQDVRLRGWDARVCQANFLDETTWPDEWKNGSWDGTVGHVVMHFCVNYLVHETQRWMSRVASWLKPGGYLSVTCIDPDKLRAQIRLSGENGVWDNGFCRVELSRKDPKLCSFKLGDRVDSDEYLVETDELEAKAYAEGLRLDGRFGFGDIRCRDFDRMTETQREVFNLYHCMIFVKRETTSSSLPGTPPGGLSLDSVAYTVIDPSRIPEEGGERQRDGE